MRHHNAVYDFDIMLADVTRHVERSALRQPASFIASCDQLSDSLEDFAVAVDVVNRNFSAVVSRCT